MARLRLGVIGAGSWTVSSHLPNLVRRRDAGEVEFTIVNRRNPALLGRIKDDFGFQQATDDWHEVIAAQAGHRRRRQPARPSLRAGQGRARGGRPRDVREAVHHRPGRRLGPRPDGQAHRQAAVRGLRLELPADGHPGAPDHARRRHRRHRARLAAHGLGDPGAAVRDRRLPRRRPATVSRSPTPGRGPRRAAAATARRS